MPTNREIYFSLIKENNKYLNRTIVNNLLCFVNKFENNLTLYKNFDNECQNYDEFTRFIERVKSGEPYQYVIGKANFIDLTFNVNPSVLIPRQETEELVIGTKVMIDKIFPPFSELKIADVCTGSGIIGLYLKKLFSIQTISVKLDDHRIFHIILFYCLLHFQ